MRDDTPQAVILFDGICNLCNSAVNYVIDHDPHGYFKLGALQSEAGQKLLRRHKLESGEYKTIILIENGHLYKQSTAALRIARRLIGPVKLTWLLIILPRFIRDPAYNWVSRNRFKWFGRRDQCRVPTPEVKERFLGD
jgi:predicted DCC family thiol-disulfide oxidoreductase YuxK